MNKTTKQEPRSLVATIVYAFFSLLFAGIGAVSIAAFMSQDGSTWSYLIFAVTSGIVCVAFASCDTGEVAQYISAHS